LKTPRLKPAAEFPLELCQRLDFFTGRLIAWNKKFSLTSVPDEKIFEKLVAPSAWLGLAYAREDVGVVVDFGAGPGIPGVPMALADRRNRYILVEANAKKVGFIRHCKTFGELGLDHLEPRHERLAGEWKEPAGAIVSRGTGPMLKIVRLFEGALGKGGRIDLFKGGEAEREIEELLAARPGLSVKIIDTPGWFGTLRIARVIFQS